MPQIVSAVQMRPQVVLFDLDGTLADTAPDLAGAANRMRERRGLPALPVDRLRPVASAGARGMIGVALGKGPADAEFEALREEFLGEYAASLAVESRLFEGVAELLAGLEAAGLPWGVVTNKAMRFTGPVLEALGLARRAAVVVAGDTTPYAKPHPEPLLEACRRVSVDPAYGLYIGDDLRDIQAARAARMPCVAAAYGYLGEHSDVSAWAADHVLPRPLDLLPLLGLRGP
jgi:phosphoglycolate phosphatase